MATTRTPGITLDARGDLVIDKEYRGTRVFRRLRRVSQEEAETVLRTEILRLEAELDLRMHALPLFRSRLVSCQDTVEVKINGPDANLPCTHLAILSPTRSLRIPRAKFLRATVSSHSTSRRETSSTPRSSSERELAKYSLIFVSASIDASTLRTRWFREAKPHSRYREERVQCPPYRLTSAGIGRAPS